MQILTDQFQKELKKHGDEQFPLLISHERLSLYEMGSFLCHWHPEIEITLILSGEMIYNVNQNSYHLKTGEALFGNANTLHAGRMFEEKDCHYISITFDPKLIYGYKNSAIYQKYVLPIIENPSLASVYFDGSSIWHTTVIDSIQKIMTAYENQPVCYEFDILMELDKLWQQIFMNCDLQSDLPSQEQNNYERIKNIIYYIDTHFSQKISLEDISAYINLCPGECSRLFKKYMHISLFTFLQEYRIEKSLEFLAEKSCSITEAALKSGFADSNYYSKVFTKYKKCSPREYRKRLYL